MARLHFSYDRAVDLGHYRHFRNGNVLPPDHAARDTLLQALGAETHYQNPVNGAHLRCRQLSEFLLLPAYRIL